MALAQWVIEHRAQGAYLGTAPHPRTGRPAPIYRAKDRSMPAALFPSEDAARAELRRIGGDFQGHRFVPVGR
jgi:hypothetical protein